MEHNTRELISYAGLIAYYLAIAGIAFLIIMNLRKHMVKHTHQVIEAGAHFLSSARHTMADALENLLKPTPTPPPVITSHVESWNIEITLTAASFLERKEINDTLKTQALPVLSKEMNLITVGPYAHKADASEVIKNLHQSHGIRSWLVHAK